MRKLAWCSLILTLVTAPSMADAAGYYVVLDQNVEGPSDIGYVGESSNIVGRYGTFGNMGEGPAYVVLCDFNGDGVPEVVTASTTSYTVDVQDFLTGDMLAQFQLSNGPAPSYGGPVTISGNTISIFGHSVDPEFSGDFNFTYDPPGNPRPGSSIFDANGDGIADQLAYNYSTNNVMLTDGATNATTSFFPGFPSAPYPDTVTFVAWSPPTAPVPEPASIATLLLGGAFLLKRRSR